MEEVDSLIEEFKEYRLNYKVVESLHGRMVDELSERFKLCKIRPTTCKRSTIMLTTAVGCPEGLFDIVSGKYPYEVFFDNVAYSLIIQNLDEDFCHVIKSLKSLGRLAISVQLGRDYEEVLELLEKILCAF